MPSSSISLARFSASVSIGPSAWSPDASLLETGDGVDRLDQDRDPGLCSIRSSSAWAFLTASALNIPAWSRISAASAARRPGRPARRGEARATTVSDHGIVSLRKVVSVSGGSGPQEVSDVSSTASGRRFALAPDSVQEIFACLRFSSAYDGFYAPVRRDGGDAQKSAISSKRVMATISSRRIKTRARLRRIPADGIVDVNLAGRRAVAKVVQIGVPDIEELGDRSRRASQGRRRSRSGRRPRSCPGTIPAAASYPEFPYGSARDHPQIACLRGRSQRVAVRLDEF